MASSLIPKVLECLYVGQGDQGTAEWLWKLKSSSPVLLSLNR